MLIQLQSQHFTILELELELFSPRIIAALLKTHKLE